MSAMQMGDATRGGERRDLSAAELDAEVVAELPTRTLMRNLGRRRRGGVSNYNSAHQTIYNSQVAVGFGNGTISQVGNNTNTNSSIQFGV